jgi:hypothetical protein
MDLVDEKNWTCLLCMLLVTRLFSVWFVGAFKMMVLMVDCCYQRLLCRLLRIGPG